MQALLAEARRDFAEGAYDLCATICDQALAACPDDPDFLHLLGAVHLRLGAPETARSALAKALAARPADLAIRFDCANCAIEMKDYDGAIRLLADGARFHPGDKDLATRLGGLLADLGLSADATLVLRAGLAANPSDIDLHMQLAGELAASFQFAGAVQLLRAARQLAPGLARLESNIGLIHQTRGELDAAIASYRQAIALSPDDPQAHMNLATALMTDGAFAEGWAEYEWRLRLPGSRVPPALPPRWQGEPLDGRRLLLTVEQGYGDIIQHTRFIPALARNGAVVLLETPPPLTRLLSGIEGLARTVPADGGTDADFQIPLLSLPLALSRFRGLEGPPEPPYLPRPAAEPGRGIHIGLVWRVKAARGDSFTRKLLDGRSCPKEALRPLLALPGVTWHSLQLGEEGGSTQTDGLPMTSHRLADFADTARLLAGLDLVIAVDTAVAHLAGAMDLPLWVMLGPYQHEYRWGKRSSPWYPKAQLFRAGANGWNGVIQQMAAALTALVHIKR